MVFANPVTYVYATHTVCNFAIYIYLASAVMDNALSVVLHTYYNKDVPT